jgi:hypothetical protein
VEVRGGVRVEAGGGGRGLCKEVRGRREPCSPVQDTLFSCVHDTHAAATRTSMSESVATSSSDCVEEERDGRM